MAVKMTLEQKAQILEFFSNGVTPHEIAQTEGTTTATVIRVLREQGIATGRKGRPGLLDKFSADQIEQLVYEYSETETPVREILGRWGLTYNQLWSALAALDVPTRHDSVAKLNARLERQERATIMYKDGAPIWKIYAETGYSSTALYKLLRERKVTLRVESQVRYRDIEFLRQEAIRKDREQNAGS